MSQRSGKPGGTLDGLGKYTIAALDWDGSLLIGWIEAEDGDAAVAAAVLHEAPMEFLALATSFLSEEELRNLRLRESRDTLRKYTVTGEAEDGRPIYEWVEAGDAAAAIHQVSFKFGKFDPHVALPGHHKPAELEGASQRFSEDGGGLWEDSVVDKPLN